MHAVKANYNHLVTQRTQLYGNLWYLSSETKPLKWEQLQIPNEALGLKANWKEKIKAYVPLSIKRTLRKHLNRGNNIGNTNMN